MVGAAAAALVVAAAAVAGGRQVAAAAAAAIRHLESEPNNAARRKAVPRLPLLRGAGAEGRSGRGRQAGGGWDGEQPACVAVRGEPGGQLDARTCFEGS